MKQYKLLALFLGCLMAYPLSGQAQTYSGTGKYVKTTKGFFAGKLCSQKNKFPVKPELKATLAKLRFKDDRPFGTLNGRPASGFEATPEKFSLGVTKITAKAGSCERYVSSGSFTSNPDGSLSGTVSEGIACSEWGRNKRSVTSYLCETRSYQGRFN